MNKHNEEETSSYHQPVLLREVIDSLNIKADGIYIDCTFGGGGHAKEILAHLGSGGRLIAFDQDDDAKVNLPKDERILFIPQNFRHLQRFLKLHKIPPVDGVLADLGVSSYQFDQATRGFSTRFEGALDMRMDQRQSLKASDVINTYQEEKLHKMFELYGEVTNAKSLAKTITDIRKTLPIATISQFKSAIHNLVKGNPNKYFAQVFQALRIEVNDEFGSLKDMLSQLPTVMKKGGRISIITFHSLEDRLVKNFFKKGDFKEIEENPFMNTETSSPFKKVTKKPVTPTEEELKVNPRSRSAKLRVAVFLPED
ncbi:MAG: 16S rRNA (cytosine(1402)-N(4))-methyltransferase RsmH [Chitinophagaceae bacterium]